MAPRSAATPVDNQVAYWSGELERAKKRFKTFQDNGDQVVDEYRLQKADGNDANANDKYNILYSSTETIRPNLYAQTPKARVKLRSTDTASDNARVAARVLENCLGYLIDEEVFDELMDAAVEDYLLPGLGCAWVRYEARFEDMKGADGKPVLGEDKQPQQTLLDEMVKMEYVYWQDFLTGVSRTWKETPWVARRLWLTKKQATDRFGKKKADQLQYAKRDASAREMDNPSETAEAWEIWDKTSRTVYWYGEGVPELLDEKADPLKLKNFFPCPKPLRAISNTRTFVPRAFYSQYKSQAKTLNVLTKRIRLLGEALRVVGLYDGSQIKLSDVLNPTAGNKMIPVDNWAMFAQNGGIQGSVQWLPIDQIVKVLNELLQAREVCKQEIYEITGFSDVVRGVSKASETLGAQNLKANWAGARVKKMQKFVQDFARDILALAGELIAEHCAPETIAVFSGVEIPSAEEIQANPETAKKVQVFKEACALIQNEMRRVSTINVETDSTLLADDSMEREDRTKFLAAAGAFLQQAVPAMEHTPELGPLLGAMLMFTVRTFPSSRPIEEEFEKVQQVLASRAQQPQDPDKDGKKAKAAADQAKAQADAQRSQADAANAQAKIQAEVTAENNRHAERMAEIELKREELRIKKFTALHDAGMAEEQLAADGRAAMLNTQTELANMDRTDANAAADRDQADAHAAADREQTDAHAAADREQEFDRMDRADAHADADREDAQVARAEAQEAEEAARAAETGDGA